MKTAITQLIEKLEDIKKNNCKHVYEVVFFDGVLSVIEAEGFLETEKKQIVNAYSKGAFIFAQFDPERHGNNCPNPEDYYNETFKN